MRFTTEKLSLAIALARIAQLLATRQLILSKRSEKLPGQDKLPKTLS
ncbi:MAG: hypothetical protein WBV73_02750 [Phormidium sp.]